MKAIGAGGAGVSIGRVESSISGTALFQVSRGGNAADSGVPIGAQSPYRELFSRVLSGSGGCFPFFCTPSFRSNPHNPTHLTAAGPISCGWSFKAEHHSKFSAPSARVLSMRPFFLLSIQNDKDASGACWSGVMSHSSSRGGRLGTFLPIQKRKISSDGLGLETRGTSASLKFVGRSVAFPDGAAMCAAQIRRGSRRRSDRFIFVFKLWFRCRCASLCLRLASALASAFAPPAARPAAAPGVGQGARTPRRCTRHARLLAGGGWWRTRRA